MKRFLCIVITAVLFVLTISGCDSNDKNTVANTNIKITDEYKGAFRVGYSRVNITPYYSVPLAGYGNSSTRMSDGFLNYLYVDCTAVSDEDNNTILLMSLDSVGPTIDFVSGLRNNISSNTGVEAGNIFITSTHTHSAPDTGNTKEGTQVDYNQRLSEWCAEAAANALNDRVPAEAYFGETEATGLSFVRHYLATDGGCFGDNHSTSSTDAPVKHMTDADTTMFMLRFERQDKKDVLFTSWRAHPQMSGGTAVLDICSDWIGAYREAVEEQMDVYCTYFQGAAGNINPKSRIASEMQYIVYDEHGKHLSEFVINAVNNLEKLEMGSIEIDTQSYEGKVDHSMDSMFIYAKQMSTYWASKNDKTGTMAIATANNLPIYSPYHANKITANYSRPATMSFEITTLSIGDKLAFTFVPYEMFDTNSSYVLDNSPFEKTVVVAYTNGKFGYVASAGAFDYGCYEADIGIYQKGTGEEVASKLVDMLNGLKG